MPASTLISIRQKTTCVCLLLALGGAFAVQANAQETSNSGEMTHKEKKAVKAQQKADKKSHIAQAEADKKKTAAQSDANEKKADASVDSAKKQ